MSNQQVFLKHVDMPGGAYQFNDAGKEHIEGLRKGGLEKKRDTIGQEMYLS